VVRLAAFGRSDRVVRLTPAGAVACSGLLPLLQVALAFSYPGNDARTGLQSLAYASLAVSAVLVLPGPWSFVAYLSLMIAAAPASLLLGLPWNAAPWLTFSGLCGSGAVLLLVWLSAVCLPVRSPRTGVRANRQVELHAGSGDRRGQALRPLRSPARGRVGVLHAEPVRIDKKGISP
jgi:hypothetical protein